MNGQVAGSLAAHHVLDTRASCNMSSILLMRASKSSLSQLAPVTRHRKKKKTPGTLASHSIVKLCRLSCKAGLCLFLKKKLGNRVLPQLYLIQDLEPWFLFVFFPFFFFGGGYESIPVRVDRPAAASSLSLSKIMHLESGRVGLSFPGRH